MKLYSFNSVTGALDASFSDEAQGPAGASIAKMNAETVPCISAPVQRVIPKLIPLGICSAVMRKMPATEKIGPVDRLVIMANGQEVWSESFGGHLRTAWDFLTSARPDAAWKTLETLVCLRQAFREDTVNCYTDDMDLLLRGSCSWERVRAYLFLARARDVAHHGSHTF